MWYNPLAFKRTKGSILVSLLLVAAVSTGLLVSALTDLMTAQKALNARIRYTLNLSVADHTLKLAMLALKNKAAPLQYSPNAIDAQLTKKFTRVRVEGFDKHAYFGEYLITYLRSSGHTMERVSYYRIKARREEMYPMVNAIVSMRVVQGGVHVRLENWRG